MMANVIDEWFEIRRLYNENDLQRLALNTQAEKLIEKAHARIADLEARLAHATLELQEWDTLRREADTLGDGMSGITENGAARDGANRADAQNNLMLTLNVVWAELWEHRVAELRNELDICNYGLIGALAVPGGRGEQYWSTREAAAEREYNLLMRVRRAMNAAIKL